MGTGWVCRRVIHTFFDTPSEMVLLFMMNPAGELEVSTRFPSTLNRKIPVFCKKTARTLPPEVPLESCVMCVHLTPALLGQLSTYVSNGLLNQAQEAALQGQWPGVIAQDVLSTLYSVQSAIQVVLAKTQVPLRSRHSGVCGPNGAHSRPHFLPLARVARCWRIPPPMCRTPHRPRWWPMTRPRCTCWSRWW